MEGYTAISTMDGWSREQTIPCLYQSVKHPHTYAVADVLKDRGYTECNIATFSARTDAIKEYKRRGGWLHKGDR